MADEPLSEAASAADCWASTTSTSPCATANQATGRDSSPDGAGGFASLGALLSAFIASSWCWLPPLLILGGVSGAGMTTFVEDYRPIFMVVTFGFLGLAFYLTYRPRRSAGGESAAGESEGGSAVVNHDRRRANIMSLNKAMLWAVTVIAVVFLFFPQSVTSLFASHDGFTADMERTVISIEGMTWHTWASKAEKAIKSAPGVLAVKVNYQQKQATIGTAPGQDVPEAEILKALDSLSYRGEFIKQ